MAIWTIELSLLKYLEVMKMNPMQATKNKGKMAIQPEKNEDGLLWLGHWAAFK